MYKTTKIWLENVEDLRIVKEPPSSGALGGFDMFENQIDVEIDGIKLCERCGDLISDCVSLSIRYSRQFASVLLIRLCEAVIELIPLREIQPVEQGVISPSDLDV